jgi:hypothetical protein
MVRALTERKDDCGEQATWRGCILATLHLNLQFLVLYSYHNVLSLSECFAISCRRHAGAILQVAFCAIHCGYANLQKDPWFLSIGWIIGEDPCLHAGYCSKLLRNLPNLWEIGCRFNGTKAGGLLSLLIVHIFCQSLSTPSLSILATPFSSHHAFQFRHVAWAAGCDRPGT